MSTTRKIQESRRVAGLTVRPGRRRQLGIVPALAAVASLTTVGVLTGGLLVTVTDPEVFPHPGTGIWWAATTITTVGYGDVVPISGAGRLVAAVLMFGGVAALAFVTAIAASSIVIGGVAEEEQEIEAHERHIERQLVEVQARLARIEALLAER
jgi:hypothetical protein